MSNMDMQEDNEEFEKIICILARAIEYYYLTFIYKRPCMTSAQTGNMWLNEILQGNESRCHNMFRMKRNIFVQLCDELQMNYGLKGSRRLCATEMLGMFLHIIGHGIGNRLS